MTQRSAPRVTRIAREITSPADVWLGIRVAAWAAVLPLLKQVLPIRTLVKLAWRRGRLTRDVARDRRVVTFARWACTLTRPRSGGNCLERGLIAYRFLLEGGAAPTLVIGVAHGPQDDLDGHAWVVLDGSPAGEPEAGLRRYVELCSFDSNGALVAAPPLHHTPPPQRARL
jgi:hypothetical protein